MVAGGHRHHHPLDSPDGSSAHSTPNRTRLTLYSSFGIDQHSYCRHYALRASLSTMMSAPRRSALNYEDVVYNHRIGHDRHVVDDYLLSMR